jgi:hypothetical protein
VQRGTSARSFRDIDGERVGWRRLGFRRFAALAATEQAAPGEGRLITGAFPHTRGEIYDLKLG